MITHIEVENTPKGLILTDKSYQYVPEFKYVADKYGEKAIIYIICMHDYWSPYRALDKEQKILIVGKDLFQNSKTAIGYEKNERMRIAIKKYNDLQYDPILDSYHMVSKKLRKINEVIDTQEINMDSVKSVQEALKGNEKINEMLMKIQEHIDELSRKSPFRGFSNIEDYHSIEN